MIVSKNNKCTSANKQLVATSDFTEHKTHNLSNFSLFHVEELAEKEKP